MGNEVQYFGGLDNTVILEVAGELAVDRMGLWSGSCRFKVEPGRWDVIGAMDERHPYALFLLMERRRVIFTAGFWSVVMDYAGMDGDDDAESDPVYELNPGVGTEPIETHPDFVSALAGTPAAVLNGAVFVDPQTGDITTSMEAGKYRFDRFAEVLSGGAANAFAGVRSYFTANNTVWSKNWTQRYKPSSSGRALKITSSPDGPHPSYTGHNWLEHPVAYTKRGNAYSCSQRWVLSGPKGWNSTIY